MATTLSEKARAFLAEPRFAVLATITPDNTPHLTVMWFELQGDEVMMNTKVGRVKEQNLRQNQRISICIEDGYNYITLAGAVRLIEDQAIAQADIRRLAVQYHNEVRAAELVRSQFAKEQRLTIRMPIEHVLERL
jgi:PPOX class probable F420-dependent enzyme